MNGFQHAALGAIASLVLGACGSASEQTPAHEGATITNASSVIATNMAAEPAPPASDLGNANVVANESAAAAPIDVTAAGFPFKTGYYVTKGGCDKQNSDIVEFTKKYRHQYEADQAEDFTKILKVGEGRYRITLHIDADEKVDSSTGTVAFDQTGPTSFKTDEKVYDYDDKGNEKLKKGAIKSYQWCPTSTLSVDG